MRQYSLLQLKPSSILLPLQTSNWVCAQYRQSVNAVGDQADDVGAAARPIASRSIRMVRIQATQDTDPVQKIVHQRIDGDEAAADVEPSLPATASPQQQH
jgi:hypothetical protein